MYSYWNYDKKNLNNTRSAIKVQHYISSLTILRKKYLMTPQEIITKNIKTAQTSSEGDWYEEICVNI